jgi:hypothetical protein
LTTRRALIWLAALCAPMPALAQAASEAGVKAAFLVKFGAYVGWPPAAGPIMLCLVGRDVFGSALDRAAAGEQIDGRRVEVRRMESISRESRCDIAFIGGSARQPVPAALAVLRGAPVLTVTDSRLGNARGMIHFQLSESRVRFHIDDRAAAGAGLGISSKLLNLALSVRMRGP